MMEFRFRRRYSLPPTDPRWLNATEEDVTLDFWAHAHVDDPKLRERIEDPDFDDTLDEMEAQILADQAQAPPRDGIVDQVEPASPDNGEMVEAMNFEGI